MGAAERVKVGVVGVGALGKHHARLYGESPYAELVGVCDVNPETAAAVAESHGCKAYPSPSALADDVSCLSVAVPTNLHFDVVTELLRQDKHILVEKPLAATVVEGRDLVALADERGLVLQVGHVERFNPVITYLEQKINQPRFIESHRLAPYPPPRPGLHPRGTEVGVVLDLMIHDIDIIMHLVNSDIARVDAVGISVLSPTEDIANARISFANGCVANLTASRISPEPMRKIRVFQSDAYLSLDYGAQQGEIVTRTPKGMNREPVPIERHNALEQELCGFLQSAGQRMGIDIGDTGMPPPASGAHALKALEIADQIASAIAENNSLSG